MAVPQRLKNRYEIREILGQGGMGIVYRAYDVAVKREVALKTLRDAPGRSSLELFQRECQMLAALSHPNIVEIFDIGEYQEAGQDKPFFVMPLLPGQTLEKLIRTASQRLTTERVVEIMVQACRGLQAAHERGLTHRDIKPSNIFVLEDDSVKLIDFGVANMIDTRTSMGIRGTLLYMSPEQLQMKPATPLSDLFSLAVVCYEALTLRRPFERATEAEIVEAVQRQTPPPVSALNPAVNQAMSRVVHKAMAKQPWHRFSSAREFAEILQKALRNEPIEFFEPARIQPRIERAQRAFAQGDLQFANEILTELEAEGHLEPAISALRRQIDHAWRQRTIAQLLDSARTRFDHQEYPLALQKIQEVLQLDPSNAAALELKSGIESRMTSQKIEDWFRLARQHLENHSYAHAREALRNVLALMPNDTRALQMLAEVDRLEQDYLRLRQQKEQLYQSAVEAWNQGEITSALSKLEEVLSLDERAPDTSSPERAAAYRSLYNQVRSEHDLLKNSYDEARKHLADRNFAQARAVCEQILAKHPGHALFQALKFDVEEQQRQEISARILEVDRRVEAEPDLDRRVAILQEAAAAFPGEPHFERALRLVRDKRDLVNSIVAKARQHEERGQFADALTQWETLGAICPQYPGLSFEVERVKKRREQQGRLDAKARTLEQIDRAMAAGDHTAALEALQRALIEFPGDAELASLEEAARQALSRTEQARQLLAEGLRLSAEQRPAEALAALRRAGEFDPRNPQIRTALGDALAAQARVLLESDWRAAEALIGEALELDPNHSLARSLRTLAQDRKRDEAVAQVFLQTRDLRAAGNLEAALAQAEQCLLAFPGEPRLLQLRDILSREVREAQEARRRAARRSALEEVRRLEREAAESADTEAVASRLQRAHQIAQQFPADAEIQSVLGDIQRHLAMVSALHGAEAHPVPPPSPPSAAPPPEAAPPPFSPVPPPSPLPVSLTEPAAAPPAAPPLVPPPAPAASPPVRPAARPPARVAPSAALGPLSKPALLGIAGAVLALALMAAAVLLLSRRSPPEAAAVAALEIGTTPPGAVIRINGEARGTSDLRLELPPGAYQIEAEREGYQPASASVQLVPGQPSAVHLTLGPLAASIRLISNLEQGQVILNEEPPRDLQEGQFTLDGLPVGKHTVKVVGRDAEASIAFETAPAVLPAATDPVTRNLAAVVVASLGSRARLYTSFGPAPVEVDGRPAGEVSPGGLELTGLAPGTHELVVGAGENRRRMVVDISPAPVLTAYLQSDRDVGTLVVVTGEDDVRVFLQGREQRRTTTRGQLRIPNLAVREYAVRVAKEGFEQEAEQRVAIRKGQESKLEFRLRPLPRLAILSIAGGPAGAQVLLDGQPIGVVQDDGSFHHSGVAPGDHHIELRRERYAPRLIQRSFAAGQTVQLSGAEVSLERLPGRLQVVVTPREARISVARPGEPPRPLSGPSAELPEGTYLVIARAPDYEDASQTVQIVAGQTQAVKFELVRVKAQPPAPVEASGMSVWGAGWIQEGGWFFRRGGNYVLADMTSVDGRIVFTAMLRRGRRLRWVVNYSDERNYNLFEMDLRWLYHTVVRNGRKDERPRVAHNLGDWVHCTLQIEVSPGAIIHRVRKGDEWTALSQTPGEPGRDYTQGKFGFYVPGDDQIGISNFRYTPR